MSDHRVPRFCGVLVRDDEADLAKDAACDDDAVLIPAKLEPVDLGCRYGIAGHVDIHVHGANPFDSSTR
jgi:N-acetylglucosamine-6-phosphate deacetylase